MYKKINIVEKLNFADIPCDMDLVEKLIKDLKVEPIYEDDDNELYFDEMGFEKIKAELSPKKSDIAASEVEVVSGALPQASANGENGKGVIAMAQSIAQKITEDLAQFIKRSDFIQEAVGAGEMKRDNKFLVDKIDQLIADNQTLINKIKELEKEADSYRQLFGNIYVKMK